LQLFSTNEVAKTFRITQQRFARAVRSGKIRPDSGANRLARQPRGLFALLTFAPSKRSHARAIGRVFFLAGKVYVQKPCNPVTNGHFTAENGPSEPCNNHVIVTGFAT